MDSAAIRSLVCVSLGLASALAGAQAEDPTAIANAYFRRGKIEYTYPVDPAVGAGGSWRRLGSLQRGTSPKLVVRYNRYVYNLTVKATNLDYATKVPDALKDLVTAEAGPVALDASPALTNIVRVAKRAEALAKGDVPPATIDEAGRLSATYLGLYNVANGLEPGAPIPASRAAAAARVDALVTGDKGRLSDARSLGQTKAVKAQKKADLSADSVSDKADAAAKAEFEVAQKTDAAAAAEAKAKAAADAAKANPGDEAVKSAAASAANQAQATEDDLAQAKAAKARADFDAKRAVSDKARTDAELARAIQEVNEAANSEAAFDGLVTQAKNSESLLYDLAHLDHLRTEVSLDARGDDITIDLSFTPAGGAPNPAAAGTTGSGAATPNGPSGPQGSLSVDGSATKPETRTFPVDFGLLSSVKQSFSLGLLYSDLRGDSVRAVPQNGGAFLVQRGVRDGASLKPLALVHLNILKQGPFYTGPSLGVTYDKSADTGYFAGWSVQYGGRDRLSLNVGWEFTRVDRLNGVSFGDIVASSDGLTKPVQRHRFEFSLTYAF